MKKGSRSKLYRWNKWRTRHGRYGTPVFTIFGVIDERDQYTAHMYLSGKWSADKAFNEMKSIN